MTNDTVDVKPTRQVKDIERVASIIGKIDSLQTKGGKYKLTIVGSLDEGKQLLNVEKLLKDTELVINFYDT